jgi:hypothetical protein
MLYDNEDQLEVRHVISLAHYSIDIYGGGDKLLEGELWIKRNCMLLRCCTSACGFYADRYRRQTGSTPRRHQLG